MWMERYTCVKLAQNCSTILQADPSMKILSSGTKIELDTHVEQILPELANPLVITGRDEAGNFLTTPAKSKITFGQLLNYTSGLDYSVDGTVPASLLPLAYSHSYKGEDMSAFFKIIKGSFSGVPLKFEPGTDFGYGFSSDCAGFVIDREYIFAPLGIKSASFYLTPSLKERLLPLAFRNASGIIERLDNHSFIDQDPANVGVRLGGVGLYSSQKDYLTILRHLLQIKSGRVANPILTLASVNKMFEPTLPPDGAVTVAAVATVFLKYLNLPAGAAQFSRGLLVTTADVPGKRKKNSGTWGGWANTSFFVDPTTGVAAVFTTQLMPTADDKHKKLWSQLEEELYAGLKA
ncbi:beta-lactamase/transpeptidase-like protein [Mycena vulgaris]|nr:beta-lactamase/transpeptidase-like protein [Mycena vulgaris]